MEGENTKIHGDKLHLVTPIPQLEAMREPTAGADLMTRHNLVPFEKRLTRGLRKDFAYFLPPQLQALVREKPRVMVAEKANFSEVLQHEVSRRPMELQPMERLRRNLMLRKKEVVGQEGGDSKDEAEGNVTVPPDVPVAQQTTNKRSPAYRKQLAKRARSAAASADSEGMVEAGAPRNIVKALVTPLMQQLWQKQWIGWGNPFVPVLTKKNAPKGYFDYIKKPMNLTWIKEKVSRNKYTKVEEFSADLELLVRNAKTFNKPTDPVHEFAIELEEMIGKELKKLPMHGLEESRGEGTRSDKRARVE
ncbi:unnamed protein product [Discosporangium mesarthrocarpum]